MSNGSGRSVAHLTEAQLETLAELLASRGDDFALCEVFTRRDNRDNGARRCLGQLIAKGYVVPTGASVYLGGTELQACYRLTREAKEAAHAWDLKRRDREEAELEGLWR